MRYAKIIDSKVDNVIVILDDDLPKMPSDWVLIKSDTSNIGDDYVNGVFIAQAPAYVVPIKILSPIAFKLRFTPQERVAIYASTDAMVKDFISILDDTRLQTVDLTLQSTIDAVNYLAQIDLISTTRKTEILA